MRDVEIKNFIIKELNRFTFIRMSRGYKYLMEAILICIKNQNAMNNLNKYVYFEIAKKYDALSYIHIKWCIEQAIRTMYNNTDAKLLSKYFNLEENKKPSIKYFIYTIVTKYEWKYSN